MPRPGTANAVPTFLEGRIAVVTGATGGIGRAIAMELAAQGAAVVVHGNRRHEAASQLVAEIEQHGSTATMMLADLADEASHAQLMEQAWNWRGAIDIWVNCAGADVLTGEAATWSASQKLEALWRIDVLGTIGLSRLIGQRMKARGSGVILNIGWDQAEQGMAGDSGEIFAAVKRHHGLQPQPGSIARPASPRELHCPGWIRTAWGQTASEYWQERAVRQSLRQRRGTPEDMARTAAFLASPAADFITGQVIAVNGGFRYE